GRARPPPPRLPRLVDHAHVPPVPAAPRGTETASSDGLDGGSAVSARHRRAHDALAPSSARRMNDAVAFMRSFDQRLVDDILHTPHGRALLTPALPLVFYLNHFSVDPGVEASAAALVDEAGPAFAELGLTHRKITVDGELGRQLE